PLQSRPVTLPDLIAQLEKMAAVLAEENFRPKLKKTQPTSAESVKAIADLAHQENLTEMAGQLDVFLTNYWREITDNTSLNLEKLLELWLNNSPIHNDHHDREQAIINEKVAIFWALLLLSSQSKVELSQEEFYQEIKINILSNNNEA
ncbi:MAG TPA: segregation/condensation protein A, partial [Allocoleopsis sp.]